MSPKVLKDERPTSNIERPTSNEGQILNAELSALSLSPWIYEFFAESSTVMADRSNPKTSFVDER